MRFHAGIHGLLLFWAGLAVRIWAIRVLGQPHADHRLRTKRLVPGVW